MTTKVKSAKKKTTVKIDRGIPLLQPGVGRPHKYPFREMKVGDSFFGERGDRLQSASSYFGTRNGMKFATRKVDGGYRVWRIK